MRLDLDALDRLVLEHIDLQQGKPEDQHRVLEDSKRLAEMVRLGRSGQAIKVANQVAPTVLEDQRLLFKLRMEQFLECLVEPETGTGGQSAIGFLRTELAPLALNAYPEAYAELKEALPAMLLRGPGCDSDLRRGNREELALLLARTIRESSGQVESRLSMLLRYLARLYQALKDEGQRPRTQVPRSVDRLGVDLANRAPPPFPLLPFQITPEVEAAVDGVMNPEILQLRTAFTMTRAAVMDILHIARGDANLAFQFEASALPIDRAFLEELVNEYMESRGLGNNRPANGGETDAEVSRLLEERRSSCRQTSPSNCREVDVHTPRLLLRDTSRSPPKKVARTGGLAQKSAAATDASEAALIQKVKFKIEQGCIEEALVDVAALEKRLHSPGRHGGFAGLAFELHSARFQQFVDVGDSKAALALAQTQLRALTEQHPSLRPRLKVVLAKLIPGISGGGASLSLSALAHLAERELRQWLGLEETQLVKLLEALLEVHELWFKLQMSPDSFESVLDIDKLRRKPSLPAFPPPPLPQTSPRSSPSRAAGALVEFGEIPLDVDLDDDVIAEAMEITSLTRVAVVNLLREVDGNLEVLLDQLYQ